MFSAILLPILDNAEIKGFESHRGHGYLSVVSVVFCHVDVSATS